jgi:hypothetical protein
MDLIKPQGVMLPARYKALRALLARCSTKRPHRASPSLPTAASFSTFRGAGPSPTYLRGRLLPAPCAAARVQTRSLAGPGDVSEDEEAVEWEDSEDEGVEAEVFIPVPFLSFRSIPLQLACGSLCESVTSNQLGSFSDRRRRGRRRSRAAGRQVGAARPRGGRGRPRGALRGGLRNVRLQSVAQGLRLRADRQAHHKVYSLLF